MNHLVFIWSVRRGEDEWRLKRMFTDPNQYRFINSENDMINWIAEESYRGLRKMLKDIEPRALPSVDVLDDIRKTDLRNIEKVKFVFDYIKEKYGLDININTYSE